MLNWIPLFIILPLLGAFLTPFFEKVFKKGSTTLAVAISGLLLLLSFGAAAGAGKGTLVYKIGAWAPPVGINFVLDGFSALILLTIAFISFSAIVFSIEYMNKFTAKAKYFGLLFLMITGMNGVVLTGDLFNLYVFLEIAAISSYALVAFGCESEELEASFKYAMLGSVASMMILLAIILLYGLTGSLNMAHIATILSKQGPNPGVMFTLALFIMGFGVKAALVPFHAWLPDAHPSAPAPISAMLSGVLIKAIGFYALIRIIFNIIGFSPLLSITLTTLGAISMLVGVFLAIGQWDLKRLLAYHSISQMGYVFLGLGLGTPLGILGGLFHLINHASFKSLLFLNSGAVEYSTGTRELKKMGGLSGRLPQTSATCTVASLSIAGVPPFNGFWSKLFIILAAIAAGQYLLAALAVLVSILTLASFLKVQKFAFFGQLPEKLKAIKEVPAPMVLAMAILALTCLGVGIFFPWIINNLLTPAVAVLLNGTKYGIVVLGGAL